MKPSRDCSSYPLGGRRNGVLLEEIGRKLESPLGAPRKTEQQWRHGNSARDINDIMTQGYRPERVVGHVARYQGSSPTALDRSSLFFATPFERTVITLHTPPVPHGPRSSSVKISPMEGACACT